LQVADWEDCAKKLVSPDSTDGEALKKMFFTPEWSLGEFVIGKELSTEILRMEAAARELPLYENVGLERLTFSLGYN
jgi:hypothetical protein